MTTIINPKWSTQGLFFFSDESIQNTAASYVTRRFCGLADVLQLKWLPVVERTELAVVKLAWMSINQANWLIVPPDGSTSTNTNAWRFPGSNTCAKKNNIDGAFACAPKMFNNRPQDCRTIGGYKIKKNKIIFI